MGHVHNIVGIHIFKLVQSMQSNLKTTDVCGQSDRSSVVDVYRLCLIIHSNLIMSLFYQAKEKTLAIAEHIGQVQKQCGLKIPIEDYKDEFNFALMQVVFEWARGMVRLISSSGKAWSQSYFD